MTTHPLPTNAGQAELDAARLLLACMGISPADLLSGATARPPAPTFAEHVPIVAKTVPDSSRRAYGSYWKKIVDQWGDRHLDEPTPSEIKQLGEHIRTTVVVRSNSRGGTSAVENFITALRCLYNQASHIAAHRVRTHEYGNGREDGRPGHAAQHRLLAHHGHRHRAHLPWPRGGVGRRWSGRVTDRRGGR
jgi:hypothetical protein